MSTKSSLAMNRNREVEIKSRPRPTSVKSKSAAKIPLPPPVQQQQQQQQQQQRQQQQQSSDDLICLKQNRGVSALDVEVTEMKSALNELYAAPRTVFPRLDGNNELRYSGRRI